MNFYIYVDDIAFIVSSESEVQAFNEYKSYPTFLASRSTIRN